MGENADAGTERFEGISVAEALRQLGTDQSCGLSAAEVRQRAARFGYNEIEEKKQKASLRFLKKFWGITPWMLELIIMLSWYLEKYLNVYIVTALLVFNAVLGFAQEEKASAAVESLRKKLQISSRVLRDGKWQVVQARDLVPGDIVRMRSGDFVPADAKIIGGNVEVDKSALTGESLPVEVLEGGMLYSGSVIRKGESSCLVVSTGLGTYFGKTVRLVQIAKPKMHSEEFTSRIVKVLLAMAGVLIGALVVFSTLRGGFVSVLPLSITLLVSAIPVALPVMFSITMALGSLELARKGVLVTRLSASDDAARMSVLCVDKTGTLTTNKISIADVYAVEGFSSNDVIRYGAMSSNDANQDPLDMAFISAARDAGMLAGYNQRSFTPFNPSTRRTEALVEGSGGPFVVTKGQVPVIASLCGPGCAWEEQVRAKVLDMSGRGYRTIAVARADSAGGCMRLVGIAALYDKPRDDARDLVSSLKELGISTKMLTGDSLPIATEIARQVGLSGSIADMASLNCLVKSDPAGAAEMMRKSDGFAEIYPEDKYRIVKGLQSQGNVVGMTGDGINDAPSLKQAEVGIAVSNATDVAKGAASVVMTEDGLGSILEVVKSGRVIYQRVMTWTLNKIIKTFQIVVFVVAAFLLTGIEIVGTFDMVLLIFLIDFVTLSISTDNVRGSRCPNSWNVGGMMKVATTVGVAAVIESLALLFVGMDYLGLSHDLARLHTFSFDILLISGIFTILVARERGPFWRSRPSRALLVAILGDLAACVVISLVGMPGFHTIPAWDVLAVLGYCSVFSLPVNDFIKTRLTRRTRL
ncbi:MAG: plasma-membrane proton-efflux P-type ATPase [Thaumarchaeota archaeon]|nr:plasma-membrane proton-efflux P-type ATPase [Nitrososphaerota archaeon]